VESLGLPEATIAAVLDAFDRARLLTFDRDPVRGEPTVELAHEALITEWPRLADWLQSVRDDLRLDQRLAAELAAWEASGHEPDYLLTGARLHDYAGWPTLTSITPTASERDSWIAAEPSTPAGCGSAGARLPACVCSSRP
jgi:hypothetical protein